MFKTEKRKQRRSLKEIWDVIKSSGIYLARTLGEEKTENKAQAIYQVIMVNKLSKLLKYLKSLNQEAVQTPSRINIK